MYQILLGLVCAMGIFIAFLGLSAGRGSGQRFDARLAQYGISTGGGRYAGGAAAPGRPMDLRERMNQLLTPAADRISARGVRRGRPSLADNLARADLKLRPSEFLAAQIGLAGLVAFICILRFGLGWQMVVFGIAGYLGPGLYVRFRQRRRLRAFNDQLGDTLILLSNALKAGYSFAQAVDTVARNASPPVSDEFGRAVREMNLGGSVDEALQNMVRRIDSPDLDLLVTAVAIHRQVGGNLAEILDNIADTIRNRIRIKGEIATLTAQAQASGWIITLLPVVLAVIMYFITPSYFVPMTRSAVGWVMLFMAGGLIGIGNAIIRKIVNIEV